MMADFSETWLLTNRYHRARSVIAALLQLPLVLEMAAQIFDHREQDERWMFGSNMIRRVALHYDQFRKNGVVTVLCTLLPYPRP